MRLKSPSSWTITLELKRRQLGNREWLDRYNYSGTGYDDGYNLTLGPDHVYSVGNTYSGGDGDLTTIKYGKEGVDIVDADG